MHKTYSTHLENLKGRRYDEVTQESVLSQSFHAEGLPEVVKYTLESMSEIEPTFSYKLFSSFRVTQDLITQQLKKNGYMLDCRYHGPHNCDAHISLYGGLELLIILAKYEGKPSEQIQSMASDIINILNDAQAYEMVDYSNQHKIHVKTRKPVSDVAIVPAIWVDSQLYQKTKLEINRGICEFNFSKKTKRVYMPFLNMARLNSRDRKLNGNIKSMVRLLSSLVADAEETIDLNYEEIVGIVFNMSPKELAVPSNLLMSMLPNLSLHLKRLIGEKEFREKAVSPSKREYVFGKKPKEEALQRLKTELDELIDDLNEGLKEHNKTLVSPVEY